ncbi:hypothetical protein SDJN02_10417, partial [Cucurbita argyrosperma subsp. argyrosperma]
MPLPWKKTKSNRISRIVADLQPSSRSASLVVETGFPTSVVDLFVKNRDRLKKHSLKKTKHKHSILHVSEPLPPPRSSSLPPVHSPPPPPLPVDDTVVIAAAGHGVDDPEEKSRVADVDFNVVVGDGGRSNGDTNANFSILVLAAKMFLAVVPVLSTKQLALGVTLSAFLLFLLEISGQFAARLFDPSSIRNRFLSTTKAECRRVGFIDRGGEGEGEEEEEEEDEEFRAINSASNKEIEMVESNCDEEESGLQGEALRNGEKGRGCNWEVEGENEEMEKNQKSRSSKLKSKIIKKLIPKKLRSGKSLKKNKKEKKKRKQEGGIMIMENQQGIEWSCEEEEREAWGLHQNWEPEEEEEEEEDEEEEEEEEEEIGSSTMVKGEVEDEEEDERKKNVECKLVIMMILVGLCGGRFVALVVTVSGCFIFKFMKSVYQKWKFG